MEQNKENQQDGTATHSGWSYFYNTFSKYRDQCIMLGKNVLGNNINSAVACLSDYHSALYSIAQQVFSFYDEETETQLTEEWVKLGDMVNDFMTKYNDKDFRSQMFLEGSACLDINLKVALLKYFNKVDRLAAEAGLLVGKEDKNLKEPKKGMIGFVRK